MSFWFPDITVIKQHFTHQCLETCRFRYISAWTLLPGSPTDIIQPFLCVFSVHMISMAINNELMVWQGSIWIQHTIELTLVYSYNCKYGHV